MSFADLEVRANTAVMQRLANATATPSGGGSDIPVIFDKATIETLGGGITADAPVATAYSADVTGFTINSTTLTISGASYLLRDKKPDGTGLTLLVLEDVL